MLVLICAHVGDQLPGINCHLSGINCRVSIVGDQFSGDQLSGDQLSGDQLSVISCRG